jgi:hypothetical protein
MLRMFALVAPPPIRLCSPFVMGYRNGGPFSDTVHRKRGLCLAVSTSGT